MLRLRYVCIDGDFSSVVESWMRRYVSARSLPSLKSVAILFWKSKENRKIIFAIFQAAAEAPVAITFGLIKLVMYFTQSENFLYHLKWCSCCRCVYIVVYVMLSGWSACLTAIYRKILVISAVTTPAIECFCAIALFVSTKIVSAAMCGDVKCSKMEKCVAPSLWWI